MGTNTLPEINASRLPLNTVTEKLLIMLDNGYFSVNIDNYASLSERLRVSTSNSRNKATAGSAWN
ncbi:MAG: hypothetical protein LBU32_10305 [Clostridiales bacterium]|nr:hypothetical protein [Clostridiales bacterium]